MRLQGIEIDCMTRAFLECALWAETDNADDSGGEPLDRNYSLADLAPETVREALEDCRMFQEDHLDDVGTSNASLEQWGQDFFLTRNHHGTGFWDRGDDQYPAEMRVRLTQAAHVWGTWGLYVGDDGMLYSHG